MSQMSSFGEVELDTYMKVNRAATGQVEFFHVQSAGKDASGEEVYVNTPITEAEYMEANH